MQGGDGCINARVCHQAPTADLNPLAERHRIWYADVVGRRGCRTGKRRSKCEM
jgi:hypothetical protein